MRILAYKLTTIEAAAMASPANVANYMAVSYGPKTHITIKDSEYPELENGAYHLHDGEHLLIFAKDKPTMIRGLTACTGSVQGSGATPQWGYLRGDYGSSFSVHAVKMSLMKQKAAVVGHELRSRGELRSALEREKLKDRGYFVLLTQSNVLGDPRTLPKFTQLPMGSRSLRYVTIGQSLSAG